MMAELEKRVCGAATRRPRQKANAATFVAEKYRVHGIRRSVWISSAISLSGALAATSEKGYNAVALGLLIAWATMYIFTEHIPVSNSLSGTDTSQYRRTMAAAFVVFWLINVSAKMYASIEWT